eukprot:g76374.t1
MMVRAKTNECLLLSRVLQRSQHIIPNEGKIFLKMADLSRQDGRCGYQAVLEAGRAMKLGAGKESVQDFKAAFSPQEVDLAKNSLGRDRRCVLFANIFQVTFALLGFQDPCDISNKCLATKVEFPFSLGEVLRVGNYHTISPEYEQSSIPHLIQKALNPLRWKDPVGGVIYLLHGDPEHFNLLIPLGDTFLSSITEDSLIHNLLQEAYLAKENHHISCLVCGLPPTCKGESLCIIEQSTQRGSHALGTGDIHDDFLELCDDPSLCKIKCTNIDSSGEDLPGPAATPITESVIEAAKYGADYIVTAQGGIIGPLGVEGRQGSAETEPEGAGCITGPLAQGVDEGGQGSVETEPELEAFDESTDGRFDSLDGEVEGAHLDATIRSQQDEESAHLEEQANTVTHQDKDTSEQGAHLEGKHGELVAGSDTQLVRARRRQSNDWQVIRKQKKNNKVSGVTLASTPNARRRSSRQTKQNKTFSPEWFPTTHTTKFSSLGTDDDKESSVADAAVGKVSGDSPRPSNNIGPHNFVHWRHSDGGREAYTACVNKNAGDAEKVKVCMSRAWRKHKAKLTKAQVNKPVSAGDRGVHGSAHDDCLSGIEEHPDDNIHMEQSEEVEEILPVKIMPPRQGKESPAVASTIKYIYLLYIQSEEVKEAKVMPVVAPTVKSEEVKEAKVMPVVAPTFKFGEHALKLFPDKDNNANSKTHVHFALARSNLDNLEHAHGKFKRRNDDSDIEYETPPYKRAAVQGGGDSIRYQNEATTAFASISPQTLAKLKAELMNYEQGDGRAFVSDDTVHALLRDIRKGASFPAAHSEKSETHVKSPQQLPRSPLASAARAMRLPSPGDFSVTGKLMTRAIDARHPQQPPEETPKQTGAKYFGASMPTHAHYFPYDRAEGLGMPGHHFPYDSGHQRKMTKWRRQLIPWRIS